MSRKLRHAPAFSPREFMRLTAVTSATPVVVACGPAGGPAPEAESEAPATEAMPMGKYQEAIRSGNS